MTKLLLADDSSTVQRVIELTFADQDVDVVAVSDGEEAISRIPIERPDVILADISMPKLSGYDVSAFVKADPRLSHIPVVLLAGAFEPLNESRARHVKSDGVLLKPFEPAQLIARVRELVASSKKPSQQASLDEYFARLEAAFASLNLTPADPRESVAEAHDTGLPAAESAVPVLEEVLEHSGGPSGEARHPRVPVDEALVEEVSRRVVERLSGSSLRDVVTDVVREVAERLVRAEIARLRGGGRSASPASIE